MIQQLEFWWTDWRGFIPFTEFSLVLSPEESDLGNLVFPVKRFHK